MATNDGLRQRLKAARAAFEAQREHERLSNRELGALVADALGREHPYSPQAVSNWMAGEEPESLVVLEALAHALGVREAWLAFGEGVMVDEARPPVALQKSKGRPLKGAPTNGQRRKAGGT